MKSNMVRASKSATVQKRKQPAIRAVEMKGEVKQSFARQVDAFIKRYRPALESLAKR
jgi:hypothetical protein